MLPNGLLCNRMMAVNKIDPHSYIQGFIMHVLIGQEHDLAWMQDMLLHPRPSGGLTALRELAGHCSDLIVLEHNKLPEDLQEYLTIGEAQRAARMGPRRRHGFLAVRLGLKLIARSLCTDLDSVPASSLHTIDDDSVLPKLPVFAGSDSYTVSASHNAELTVVAASTNVFGIDIENRAVQAWRGRNFFMHNSEQEMARQFPLGPEKAALRVWSSKEVAVKAFKIDLGRAAQDVYLTKIGDLISDAKCKNQKFDVLHYEVEDNLITILVKYAS